MLTSFGFSGKSDFFEKKAIFAKQYIYSFLTVLGALFLALGGDFSYTIQESKKLLNDVNSTGIDYTLAIIGNNWVLFFLGAALLLLGTIGNYLDSKALLSENEKLKEKNVQVSNLESELNSTKEENESLMASLQKKHQELVRNWLKTLYNDLKLTSNDRLTIYFVHDGEFTLLARYSSNPKIRKIHNQRFPLNKGVISLTWEHGEYIEKSCPCYDTEPEEYTKYIETTYNYNSEEIEHLTMKSNKYFGLSILDADDTVGVIIFENCEDGKHEGFEKNSATIRRYGKRYESYLSGFVREARRLDRLSHVQNGNRSVELEALEAISGGV